jgi:hypothetical protein
MRLPSRLCLRWNLIRFISAVKHAHCRSKISLGLKNVNLLLHHLQHLPGISNCTLKQNVFRSDRTIEAICSCPYKLCGFRSILAARKDVLWTGGITNKAFFPVHEACIKEYKMPVATEYYCVVITTKFLVNILDRRLKGNTWRMLKGGEA